MGFLRFYLALCVVAAHARAWVAPGMVDSVQAVQIFYLISGFYMQLILYGKYSGVAQFYQSRALRIYIPYLVVVLIVLTGSVISGIWGGHWIALETYMRSGWGGNEPVAVVLAAVTNGTLFGQDVIHFLNGAQGEFLRFRFSELSSVPLWRYLLIPQSWTIAVELTFYVVVPFLTLLRARTLVMVLFASLLLRVLAYEVFGLNADPWIYRFFPFELALFVSGMLACRVFLARGSEKDKPLPYALLVPALLLVAFALNGLVGACSRVIGWHYAVFISYLFIFLVLPMLFGSTMRNRLDRMIGELSFPVYLNHFFVIQLTDAYGFPSWVPEVLEGEFVMIASTLFAIALLAGFLLPFERWRQCVIASKSEPEIAKT